MVTDKKFTKGEWFTLIVEKHFSERAFVRSKNDEGILTILETRSISNFEEQKANAKLIADAGNTANKCGLFPSEILEQRNSLIESLEHIIEYWNQDRNDGAMYNALWHIIETAEEAIKKATE